MNDLQRHGLASLDSGRIDQKFLVVDYRQFLAALYDVVTFGEAMIRLAPPNFRRLEQATSLDVQVGGAELNTAVGLAKLGSRVLLIDGDPQANATMVLLAGGTVEGPALADVLAEEAEAAEAIRATATEGLDLLPAGARGRWAGRQGGHRVPRGRGEWYRRAGR